jgi:hypothetical protein
MIVPASARILPAVDCKDNDLFGSCAEIDRVGKRLRTRAEFPRTLKGQGVCSDACNDLIDFCAELFAETFASRLMPTRTSSASCSAWSEHNIARHP